MTPQDEIAILKADRENLHQRVRELLTEIDSLRDQLSTEREITANLSWAIENPMSEKRAQISDGRKQP